MAITEKMAVGGDWNTAMFYADLACVGAGVYLATAEDPHWLLTLGLPIHGWAGWTLAGLSAMSVVMRGYAMVRQA